MGKLVNVVTSTGKVVAVPEEEATLLQQEAPDQATQRAIAEKDAADNAGVVSTLKAAAEGGLDTLSLGAYGKIEGALSPEAARQSAIRAEQHPYARGAGEVAALIA